MIDTDTVLDRGMVYFDARLSAQHPTLEIRVADVCLDVDDAVLLAALARALVETAVRAWRAGTPRRPGAAGAAAAGGLAGGPLGARRRAARPVQLAPGAGGGRARPARHAPDPGVGRRG